MSIQLIVPTLGESITEATVSKWLKKIGDQVSEGEIICEIETSKSTMELPIAFQTDLGLDDSRADILAPRAMAVAIERKCAIRSSPAQ